MHKRSTFKVRNNFLRENYSGQFSIEKNGNFQE